MANRVGNEGYNYFSEKAFKNLEKAIDLLIKYQSIEHKTAKDGAEAIQNQIELRTRYEKQLKALGVALDEDVAKLQRQYEYEKEIYESKKKQIALEEKQRQQRNREARENKRREESNRRASKMEKEIRELTDKSSKREVENQKKINSIMDEAIKKSKNLLLTEKQRKEIRDNAVSAINIEKKRQQRENSTISFVETALGLAGGSIDSAMEGGYGWKVITNTFAKAVEVFRDAVRESINANYNSTEKTLNSITASNRISWNSGSFSFGGRTYNGYSQINNAVNDKLWSEGLYNNIANTDVIEAAARLTTEDGLDLEKALAKGYEDTVIKYIVPYLDTASETFTNLDFLMPGMSKGVAAIAVTTRDQIGESRYLSKYAEELAQLLEPVSLQANEQLYSEEFQSLAAMTEAMLKAGVFQSPAEAQKYLHQAFGIYNNPSGKISNGSTIEKWTAISALQNGDIDSPTGIMNALMGNTTEALSWGGNDSIIKSIIQNSFGLNSFRSINTNNMDEAQKIMNDFQSKSYDELLEIYDIEKKNADDYNTNTDKLDKLLLNATSDIGDIKAVITDKGWVIGEVIVKGITTWLAAKLIGGVIGKGIGALTGLGGGSLASGSGIGALLGSAGPIALGVGAAAVLVGSIVKAVWDNRAKENKELSDAWGGDIDNQIATQKANGVTGSKAVINAINSINYAKNTGANFDDWGGNKDLTSKYGIEKKWYLSSYSENQNYVQKLAKSADWEKYNQFQLDRFLSHFASDEILSSYLLPLLIGINENKGKGISNLSKAIDTVFGGKIGQVSDANIKSLLEASDITYAGNVLYTLSDIQSRFGEWFDLRDDGGNRMSIYNVNVDTLKSKYNLHRQGLSEVPYDNYLASLHQGEAVLTASTANELRNLLDEYRSNTHISANLDVVIQQQTVTLCNKLDEVVRAINTSNTGSFTTAMSEYQARAHNLLRNSMITMTSTKEALN